MAEKRKFLLRLDSDLWDDLQAWAGDELRSVNGQIEYILRQAVRQRHGMANRQQDEGADRTGRDR